MTISQIVEKFKTNPSYLQNGANTLASIFKCDAADIRDAKNIIKQQKEKNCYNSESNLVKQGIDDGFIDRKKVTSPKPLSPEAIENLAGVDNITTYVSRVWEKLGSNGIWTYSIDIRYKIKDFYNDTELKKKLQDLFPKINKVNLPKVKVVSNVDTLIIYVSDIHAGAINSELSVYSNKYNESILSKRLQEIVLQVIAKNKKYKEVYIVNLGDSLDGFDGFTVKRKHSLGSDSNKNQFNIFVKAMTLFYDSIFATGITSNYKVWNCLNANHDGNGLSYMANKTVEIYLEGKYPQVEFIQQEEFIKSTIIQGHYFAFTHGKDATLMKYPMKKYVDDKLDSWIMQYFQSQQINTQINYCHLRRGDLHQFVQEHGKFGDSLVVPSIYGTSEYIELNYGNTHPGALLEEVSKNIKGTVITPIWF